MTDLDLKRYMALFRGNARSVGQWHPKRNKGKGGMETMETMPGEDHFRAHLSGEVGIGVVPIRDDGMCFFAAIDIDNHDKTEDLDLPGIEARVRGLKLPLLTCRSKSGGAHLYMFGSEPLKAAVVRTLMGRWMSDLRVEGSDCVFPKQDRLVLDGEGKRPFGNWINLPYFGGDEGPRYAVLDGKPVSLDLFLTTAETGAVSQADLDKLYASEHSEAPPCLQAKFASGFGSGERNVGAFQVAVYFRKKDPATARDMSHETLSKTCQDPLPFGEADRTIRSALRKDYGYKCGDEPFKTLCDKEACRKRKFGISEREYDDMQAKGSLPKFSDLVKYDNTDPVRWELGIGDKRVLLTTIELFDFAKIRERGAELLHIMLPRLKGSDWDVILKELVGAVRIESTPDDSSPVGAVRVILDEFIRKADLSNDGREIKDRDSLLRGVPVVQIYRGTRMVMFRGSDFSAFLRAKRADQIKSGDVWIKAGRLLGLQHDRVRIGTRIIYVWMASVPDQDMQNVPDFKPEI